jgi:hypothetical protein
VGDRTEAWGGLHVAVAHTEPTDFAYRSEAGAPQRHMTSNWLVADRVASSAVGVNSPDLTARTWLNLPPHLCRTGPIVSSASEAVPAPQLGAWLPSALLERFPTIEHISSTAAATSNSSSTTMAASSTVASATGAAASPGTRPFLVDELRLSATAAEALERARRRSQPEAEAVAAVKQALEKNGDSY